MTNIETTVHGIGFGMPAQPRVMSLCAAPSLVASPVVSAAAAKQWAYDTTGINGVVSGPATLARTTDAFPGSAWSPPS